MRQMLWVFLLSFGSAVTAQTSVQLTQVPPKPTCTPFLTNGACANLWTTYNQALAQRQREELQLYINRQKELATSAATAPLQQQIDDLNKLVSDQQTQIKKLQDQMQADAAAALQAASQTKDSDAAALLQEKTAALQEKSAAHKQGLWQGLAIGAGAMLLLVVLVFIIRRLARSFTITKKSQTASA